MVDINTDSKEHIRQNKGRGANIVCKYAWSHHVKSRNQFQRVVWHFGLHRAVSAECKWWHAGCAHHSFASVEKTILGLSGPRGLRRMWTVLWYLCTPFVCVGGETDRRAELKALDRAVSVSARTIFASYCRNEECSRSSCGLVRAVAVTWVQRHYRSLSCGTCRR